MRTGPERAGNLHRFISSSIYLRVHTVWKACEACEAGLLQSRSKGNDMLVTPWSPLPSQGNLAADQSMEWLHTSTRELLSFIIKYFVHE